VKRRLQSGSIQNACSRPPTRGTVNCLTRESTANQWELTRSAPGRQYARILMKREQGSANPTKHRRTEDRRGQGRELKQVKGGAAGTGGKRIRRGWGR